MRNKKIELENIQYIGPYSKSTTAENKNSTTIFPSKTFNVDESVFHYHSSNTHFLETAALVVVATSFLFGVIAIMLTYGPANRNHGLLALGILLCIAGVLLLFADDK